MNTSTTVVRGYIAKLVQRITGGQNNTNDSVLSIPFDEPVINKQLHFKIDFKAYRVRRDNSRLFTTYNMINNEIDDMLVMLGLIGSRVGKKDYPQGVSVQIWGGSNTSSEQKHATISLDLSILDTSVQYQQLIHNLLINSRLVSNVNVSYQEVKCPSRPLINH